MKPKTNFVQVLEQTENTITVSFDGENIRIHTIPCQNPEDVTWACTVTHPEKKGLIRKLIDGWRK